MKRWWDAFRKWAIYKLGGCYGEGPKYYMLALLNDYIPKAVVEAATRAFEKVEADTNLKPYIGSNLGRVIERDEAAEWTKLYLKEQRKVYWDSDVHLACELIYHLRKR